MDSKKPGPCSTHLLALATFLCATAWPLSRSTAYVRTRDPVYHLPVRWLDPRTTLELVTTSLPRELSEAGAISALRAAAAVWSKPAIACSRVEFRIQRAASPLTDAAPDGVNRVVFYTHDWCRSGVRRLGACYSRQLAAVTTLSFGERLTSGERPVIDADIELNLSIYGGRPTPTCGRARSRDRDSGRAWIFKRCSRMSSATSLALRTYAVARVLEPMRIGNLADICRSARIRARGKALQ